MEEVDDSKQACPKCGAGVRENTSYCYSCGTDVRTPPDVEPETASESEKALDELAEKLSAKPKDDGGRAKAAAERRKARVSQRKVRQYVWEPSDTPPAGLLLLVAGISLILAAVAVYAVLFAR